MMKYFTFELIAAANDWVEQSDRDRRKAERILSKAVEQYHHELENLRSRISQTAWYFFRHGFAHYGLHDGRLLSITIGDGLSYIPDGTFPHRINRQRTSARVEFLNYEQDFHYTFDLRGVKGARCELFTDDDEGSKIGDLFTYELTRGDAEDLQLGFLFASGATIILQFRRLVFRRRKINRKYDVNEIYG